MDKKEVLKKLKASLDALVNAKKEQDAEKAMENDALYLMSLLNALGETERNLEKKIDETGLTNQKSLDEFRSIVSQLKIEAPQVHVAVPDVIVPEIKIPPIVIPPITVPTAEVKIPPLDIPPPKVTVHVPEAKAPVVNFPDSMAVTGDVGLRGIDRNSPLPVLLYGPNGKPYTFPTFMSGSGGKANAYVIQDILTSQGQSIMDEANKAVQITIAASQISLLTKQVSGTTNSIEIASQPFTLDIKQVSGSVFSVTTVGLSFLNVTSNNTTVLVKSGTGTLHTVVINTRGTGSNVILYDNTQESGTKVGTIDTTLSTTSFLFDVAFTNGLTILLNNAAVAADLTFTYG